MPPPIFAAFISADADIFADDADAGYLRSMPMMILLMPRFRLLPIIFAAPMPDIA